MQATEALLFNGGGYTIEVVIGFLDEPVIAQVRFTPPGAKDWASLPRDLLRIEKFDMKKSILIMHFSNKNNPDLPASFSLSANNTRGILSLAATGIESAFLPATTSRTTRRNFLAVCWTSGKHNRKTRLSTGNISTACVGNGTAPGRSTSNGRSFRDAIEMPFARR